MSWRGGLVELRPSVPTWLGRAFHSIRHDDAVDGAPSPAEQMRLLLKAGAMPGGATSVEYTLGRIVSATQALVNSELVWADVIDRSGVVTMRVSVTRDGEPTVVDCLGQPACREGTVAIAIRAQEETLGTVQVAPASASRSLSADDVDLLTAFVAAAANSLANALYYEALQRSQRWLSATVEVTSSLLRLESADVLDTIVSSARRLTGASAAWILLPQAGDRVVFGAADGTGTAGLRGKTLALEHVPVYRKAMATLAPVVANELEIHPSAKALIEIDRLMAVPLVARDRPLGSLMIGSLGAAEPFRDTDLQLAMTFAAHAAMALEFDRFTSDRERLALLEERNRIGRDLHDVVIQRIFAVGLRIEGLHPRLDDPVGAVLIDCCDELDGTIADLRRAIFSLRTRGGGLNLRLQVLRQVDQAAIALGFRPELTMDGPLEDIGDSIRDHALATLGEALSNIAKHSAATRVTVSVGVRDAHLEVIVADNGLGLPADRRPSGLGNLAARAEELHGTLTLENGLDGRGLSLTWRVPVVES